MTEPLSDTELEILRILWEEHPLKPGEIVARFSHEIDNGTLRSNLVQLVAKGKLQRNREGKAFVYLPVVKRQGLLQSVTKRLSRAFTGGSSSELVMELVRTERFTPEQLDELRRIADSHPASTPRKRKNS